MRRVITAYFIVNIVIFGTWAQAETSSSTDLSLSAEADNSDGQDSWRDRQRWPISLSGHSQSFGFRPQGLHPGFALGTELTHVSRRVFRFVQPIELGFFYHREFQTGYFLDTTFDAQFVAPFGLYGSIGLTIGVQHAFFPGTTYTLENGRYVEGGNTGRVNFRAALGLTLGYNFSSLTSIPLRVFVRYQQYVTAPFALKNDLPVMAHSVLSFGLLVELRRLRRNQ